MRSIDKACHKYWVLYVGNLPPEVSESEIRELFGQHGDVHSVMLLSKDESRPNRFGWVTMRKAKSVIAALNETNFAGHRLQVMLMGLWVTDDISLQTEKFNRRACFMNMTAVREKAKVLGIKPGRMKKVDLIRAIQNQEGYNACFKTHMDHCEQSSCCWRADCLSA